MFWVFRSQVWRTIRQAKDESPSAPRDQRGGSRVNGRRCFCFSQGKKSGNNVWKCDFSAISHIYPNSKIAVAFRTWLLLEYLSAVLESWSLFDAPFGNSLKLQRLCGGRREFHRDEPSDGSGLIYELLAMFLNSIRLRFKLCVCSKSQISLCVLLMS